MSRRKIETSVPFGDVAEAQRINAEIDALYPERCPNCGFKWPLPGRHQCPPEALADLSVSSAKQEKTPIICPDCGCWTGGAACPHCTNAPHPRGRT